VAAEWMSVGVLTGRMKRVRRKIGIASVALAAVAAALLVYLAIKQDGPVYAVTSVPIVLALYFAYKLFIDRDRDRARHIDELTRLHLAMVEALATAIDAKDEVTHGHVRRVQIYAEGLARLYRLGQDEIEAIKIGALLHDVGKLAVPDYILNKPGKLTAAEFDKMKIHTIVGAQIMERVGFPYPVVPIVRHHHERWDGRGYPDGLSGNDIPITARILSVADCFDAVHKDRQYRRGLSRDEAINLLRDAAGNQFDPRIVERFIEHLPSFEAEIAKQQVVSIERPAAFLPAAGSTAVPAAGLSEASGDASLLPPSYLYEIKRANREAYVLYEVAGTFGSSLNIEDALAIIRNKLSYLVQIDTCAVYNYDEARGIAIAAHVTGLHAEQIRGRRITPGEGITGYVLVNRQPFAHTDPMLEFADLQLPLDAPYRAAAVFPLEKDGLLLGALAFYAITLKDYSEDDVRLLERVAQLASNALDNAIRYAKTKSDALTDLLTNLPNARALQQGFEREAARAEQAGTPLHLLMIDLDNFKKINDNYGHSVGDRFLKAISRQMNSELGTGSILARYAGDEFVALVSDISEEECTLLCERLQRSGHQFAFVVPSRKYADIGISIGRALYGRDGATIDELLRVADQQMYANKNSRNPLRVTGPLALTTGSLKGLGVADRISK
jgi:diguanylate cyclase (GGDEF)-like protein/putative nucleotidyltransferase with HDIG domain